MFHIVYLITNLINNKKYIGVHSTNNLDDGYMGSGKLIIKAIKKYGIENFKREILYQFDTAQEAYDKERELVTEKIINNNEYYNLREGGKNCGILSDEVRARISRIQKELHVSGKVKPWNKGIPHSKETKEKISKILKNKNRKLSEEHKEKIRQANLGKKISYETIQKRILKTKGRKLSEKQKQILSKVHKGKTISQKHREQISAFNKGKKLSKEHKTKQSEAHKKLKFKCPHCDEVGHTSYMKGRHIPLCELKIIIEKQRNILSEIEKRITLDMPINDLYDDIKALSN